MTDGREPRARGDDAAFVEESWILVGEQSEGIFFGRLIGHASGEASTVDLGWRRALGREERYGDVVGFLHTHPPGVLGPSVLDVSTMRSWCSCFGKRLLCAISAGDRLAGYIFDSDGYRPAERIVRLVRPAALIGVDHGGQASS